MPELPYRTNSTSLSDDELLLLDVLFRWKGTWTFLLRREGFTEQWNHHPHNFTDSELHSRLQSLCAAGVLRYFDDERFTRKPGSSTHSEGPEFVGITALSGDLWSDERLPQWDRFCYERFRTTQNGLERMSVVAVSPKIRDDFLELWPECAARRRKTTIVNHNPIPWHPFPMLYVGMVTYREQHTWISYGQLAELAKQQERVETRQRERSWWRNIQELQKFVPHRGA